MFALDLHPWLWLFRGRHNKDTWNQSNDESNTTQKPGKRPPKKTHPKGQAHTEFLFTLSWAGLTCLLGTISQRWFLKLAKQACKTRAQVCTHAPPPVHPGSANTTRRPAPQGLSSARGKKQTACRNYNPTQLLVWCRQTSSLRSNVALP